MDKSSGNGTGAAGGDSKGQRVRSGKPATPPGPKRGVGAGRQEQAVAAYAAPVAERRVPLPAPKAPPRASEREPARGGAASAVRERPSAPRTPRAQDAGAGPVGENPSSASLVGSIVDGKYKLTELLGEGGMGAVFVARNELLDTDVALKLIRANVEGADEDSLSGRLLQEARAAARVEHPAITRVFDIGVSDEGDPYIVMELLHGEDLATVIERRAPLAPVKAVQTLLPVAHALALAHEKGVVHRDIKPDNIILARTEHGRVQPKLIDFGVAKAESRTARKLTRVGTLVGTPDYMSPEQARGQEVNASTDVWSLSVVLYEMLSGEMPFGGDNYNALMVSIMEAQPTPLVSLEIGDAALSAILDQGLAKRPAERWASMRQLGEALARWLMEQGVNEDISGAPLGRTWFEARRPGAPADVFATLPPPADPGSGASPGAKALPLLAALPDPSSPQAAPQVVAPAIGAGSPAAAGPGDRASLDIDVDVEDEPPAEPAAPPPSPAAVPGAPLPPPPERLKSITMPPPKPVAGRALLLAVALLIGAAGTVTAWRLMFSSPEPGADATASAPQPGAPEPVPAAAAPSAIETASAPATSARSDRAAGPWPQSKTSGTATVTASSAAPAEGESSADPAAGEPPPSEPTAAESPPSGPPPSGTPPSDPPAVEKPKAPEP